MPAAIAANLVADLIWAPFVWIALRLWRRELQRHHNDLAALHRRLDDLLNLDDEPADGRPL